ncbi:CehA/McbA family metallohydrolase domain-containing protein [Dysgonomonas reticulitermitis]
MNRRRFIGSAGITLAGIAAGGSVLQNTAKAMSNKNFRQTLANDSKLKVYWGDIHNHCNLTYGHGGMQEAFEAARQQLDFVSVTPHAMWPDIPGKNDLRLEWVIEYHESAFRRLRAGGWDKYVKMTNDYNKEREFLTFLTYECHSMEHGDHVVLNYDLNAPLVECTSVEDLKQKLKETKTFITPHHMGYQEGYRGYNWKHFSEGDQTPFVEMYSRHGLAESDLGDYPYLHDMGPRHWEGTIMYGLNQGHKFGIMGSTDQHAGYPGSYGDGRIGILATELTREAIWNALKNRKVCCATGDKIIIDFRINDATMGDVIRGNKRHIYLNVIGESAIDYIDIVKNGQTIGRISGPLIPLMPSEDMVRAKVKFEFGWNRFDEPVKWEGTIKVSEGTVNEVTPCFRGAPYTAPMKGIKESPTLVNRILQKNEKGVQLEMYSTKNPNTTTASTQAVIMDITMPKWGKLMLDFNGQRLEYTLNELFVGTKTHFMNGWLSEAIQSHRAIPVSAFVFEHFMTDDKPEKDTDYYYIRVRQRDNQWAWSSPIWVEKA